MGPLLIFDADVLLMNSTTRRACAFPTHRRRQRLPSVSSRVEPTQTAPDARCAGPAVRCCAVVKKAEFCLWCGREVANTPIGRRRRYCKPSCRQRAYEQRQRLQGTTFPADATVLTAQEVTALAERAFTLRCAAEDVATAVSDGAGAVELTALCASLVELAAEAERWR